MECEPGVLTRVALDGESLERLKEILNLGPNELRRSTQGVPILAKLAVIFIDGYLFLHGLGKDTALEKVEDVFGCFNLRMHEYGIIPAGEVEAYLARMRSYRADEWVEGCTSASESLSAHCGQDLRKERKVNRIVQSQRC